MKPMHITRLVAVAVACAAVGLVSIACQAQQAPAVSTQQQETRKPATHDWLERSWEWRYILFVSDGWSSEVRVAQRSREKEDRDPHELRSLARAFNPTVLIPAPVSSPLDESLAVVAVEFDKQGFVTTAHTDGSRLRGRINRIQSVLLSAGDDATNHRYHLGFWFTGLGDVSTHWAPAICVSNQKPDAAQVRSDGYLYGRLFKPNSQSTTFGCREWAYQLYDPDRPYIDVTSYVPKDADYPDGSYIREFIGWARFDDRKPVIGKDGKTWVCLHDCPNGDKPGVIPDITAWAKRSGWAVPTPPSRMPMFPDPPGKTGVYRK